jgi:hypothetical protein
MEKGFEVNRLIHECIRDANRMEEFVRDPQAVVERYRLTSEERQAFLTRNVAELARLGANPLILVEFALSMGVDIPQYLAAMASVG